MNGLQIDNAKSFFDFGTDNNLPVGGITKLEIMKNEDRVKTKTIQDLKHKLNVAKTPPLQKIQELKERGTIDTFVDNECRKKNGKINLALLGKWLGCDPKTAEKLFKEDKDIVYLLRPLHERDSSAKMVLVPKKNKHKSR